MAWVVIAVALFGPALALVAATRAPEILDAFGSVWSTLRSRRAKKNDAVPVELLAADLHRLAVNLTQVEGTNAPAKMARLRAASLAYDEVLLSACRALEIPEPGSSPLDPLERLEAEAVLAQHGLDW